MLQLDEYLRQLMPIMIQWRRDFHLHVKSDWLESRTASKVAEILDGLGHQLALGCDVIDADNWMGLPDKDILVQAFEHAREQGVPERWLSTFEGGLIGTVATLSTGWSGPTLAFRISMDTLDLNEQYDDSHYPHRDHFVSCNVGVMHACGHGGHIAIGLGLAHALKQYVAQLNGMIKLIFQSAEEGTRGARTMVTAGVVDDADYFTAIRIGTGVPVGIVVYGGDNFMATTKSDVQFSDVAAHTGDKPEEGRNALLTAAQTILGLHTIPPHSAGTSRVNVEVMQADTGRNMVPSSVLLKVETRGESEAINQYMFGRAQYVAAGAATMYEACYELRMMDAITASVPPSAWVDHLCKQAARVPGMQQAVGRIIAPAGSEDAILMIVRVQACGDLASCMIFGTQLSAGYHNEKFDFDESATALAAEILAYIAPNPLWQRRV